MLFDDRLATVLRSGAAGEQAARTQFRQLLDLLGSTPSGANGPLVLAAYRRLGEIQQMLPATEQSRILREPWLRLRNPRLLAFIAAGDPQAAAAAMATARLDDDQWLALIPDLPLTARGFLRHRRDMPEGARNLLARLGVRDLVLPRPQADPVPEPVTEPEPVPELELVAEIAGEPDALPGDNEQGEAISVIVKRIEAFQVARRSMPAELSPRLPLDDGTPVSPSGRAGSCDFSSDATGQIDWAEGGFGPLLVGLSLRADGVLDPSSLSAIGRYQPIRAGRISLQGVAAVAGEWLIDAAPHFHPENGACIGYRGRLRRPILPPDPAAKPRTDPAGRMRQVLHELRTPVNAIQGFAEIIQQQLFGSAPNSYRALAAGVGVDAARLLAGFDEIDRLVRLDSQADELSSDGCDLRPIIEGTIKRLDGVMRPRSARMRLAVTQDRFEVQLGAPDAAQLVWRLLGTLAGALSPGELLDLGLTHAPDRVSFRVDLPASLDGDEVFDTAAPSQSPAITAGMFGTGFTLRLARAEAESAGGSLDVDGDALLLTLPALTNNLASHSVEPDDGGGQVATAPSR